MAVLAAGLVLVVGAVLFGPIGSEDAPAEPAAVPLSDIYSGPDAERRPLDRRVVFSDVPDGWGEDVPSREFGGFGDSTSTITTFFTDATGETGDDALPDVFVCLTYAAADTCTFAGPELITERKVGSGVLLKITGVTEAKDGGPARQLSQAQRAVWADALAVRFEK